jgi:formylglycine-generating enzyme required for sulfatase activity
MRKHVSNRRRPRVVISGVVAIVGMLAAATTLAQEPPAAPSTPAAEGQPAFSEALAQLEPAVRWKRAAEEMKPYRQAIADTEVAFDLVVIPGGRFTMGSPEGEEGRKEDEGPQREVEIEPFWMGKCEVSWDEYDLWSYALEQQARGEAKNELDRRADAVTRPTKPYTDMTFGMGHDGFPAICMTQFAARKYCEWLSAKTGHSYRLPTEAEWEYACRAGTKTAYHFGDDPEALGEYAWFDENAEGGYHKVGQKKANPWGLHDMHGNVAEWCLDKYVERYAPGEAGKALWMPFVKPDAEYRRVARGGSWEDFAEDLRSAARRGSEPAWKQKDPQLPKSIWYFTDALFLGFRVVRPYNEDPAKLRLEEPVNLGR